MRSIPGIALIALIACSCSSSRRLEKSSTPVSQLKLVNEFIYPPGKVLNGNQIGGLSSIDYDAEKNQYYLICDDPGAKGYTRFFTANIDLSEKGIDTVIIKSATQIMNPRGIPYTDISSDRPHSFDAESLRYYKKENVFIIGSEGQKQNTSNGLEIENPQVVMQHIDGTFADSFALPANMQMHVDEKGTRHNAVFEGLTITNDQKFVYVNTEAPIYEDGPTAGLGDSTSYVRINKFNIATRKLIAQLAYPIDAVPYPATPAGAFKINGVTDLLYLGNKKMLVLERAYSTGRGPSDVRLYLADLSKARNILSVSGFQKPATGAISKQLILNFESLGMYIDNLEGVTFGPMLPNGHRSLIFVADNDFKPERKMQFLLFEIIP